MRHPSPALARPLIAVTTARRGGRVAWSGARYLVRWAGGCPIRIRPGTPGSTGPIDGLIVLGGVDVSPALYGEPVDSGRELDPLRDESELALIERAIADGVPILGVCRGAQLLNVALGGSLTRIARRPRIAVPYRRARIASGSILAGVIGAGHAWINTLHDYAVDRLGDGLAVSAIDSAGLVQAIERRAAPMVLGVQWHPELMPYARASRRLFAGLVAAARSARPGSSARPDRARA